MLNFGVLVQELLNGGLFNFPLILTVHLVAHQNEWEFFWLLGSTLVKELRYPALDVVEGLAHPVITRLLVISYTSTQQSAPL